MHMQLALMWIDLCLCGACNVHWTFFAERLLLLLLLM